MKYGQNIRLLPPTIVWEQKGPQESVEQVFLEGWTENEITKHALQAGKKQVTVEKDTRIEWEQGLLCLDVPAKKEVTITVFFTGENTHIEALRVKVGKESIVKLILHPGKGIRMQYHEAKVEGTLSVLHMNTGHEFISTTIHTHLFEKATLDLATYFLTKGTAQSDVFTKVEHHEKETKANIVTRGVVKEKGKGIARGHVHILPAAAQSEGYEQLDILLVDDTAEADAIPDLEIGNHDVQCSHGATVGSIDEEELFYLMSRGISQEKAEEMIVKGFLSAPAFIAYMEEAV